MVSKKRFWVLTLALLLVFSLCACGSGTIPEPTPEPTKTAMAAETAAPTPEESEAPSSDETEEPAPSETPDMVPEETAVPSVSPTKAPPSPSAAVVPDPTPDPTPEPTPAAETVSVTVNALGTTLVSGSVPYTQGMTAYDALNAACAASGVSISQSGSGSSVYIRGIGGYKEFDEGPGSGWLYFVNGVSPSRSCGAVELSPGDNVRFSYTTNYGQDLN